MQKYFNIAPPQRGNIDNPSQTEKAGDPVVTDREDPRFIDPRYPEFVALDVAERFAALFHGGETNFDLADMVTTTEGDNFRVNVEVMLRGNPSQEEIARAEEMLDIAKKSVIYDTLFKNGIIDRIYFDTSVSLRDADLIAAGRI